MISDVKEDSPADHAGLKQGDVIIEYQGMPVEDSVVLQRLVTRTPVGTKVPVKVIREGREREVTLKRGANVLMLIDRRGNSLFLSAKV